MSYANGCRLVHHYSLYHTSTRTQARPYAGRHTVTYTIQHWQVHDDVWGEWSHSSTHL